MKITVGCSMKYRGIAIETVQKLEQLGLVVLFPNLKQTDQESDVADTLQKKKQLAIEHYTAIDEADVVYLIVPSGVMGTSLKLELGYAVAKGKPVYFSEPTKDLALDCYVKEFITLDSLDRFLKLK
jgi:nucleoside 2-deoxyribosyltransferase